MKIALIGYSDLGRYIREMLLEAYDLSAEDFIYFDDHAFENSVQGSYPFTDYMNDKFSKLDFYVCLGYKHLKIKNTIISQLVGAKRNVPNFIHSSSYVHPSVTIGAGSFIYPGCNIDRNTVIGRGVWIANGDIIAHDCKIGDCCWFGASVTLSGKVTIAENNFIGSGTVISNDVLIGSGNIIGLGTVVTKNLSDNLSVIGNPMRILDKPLTLK